MVVPSTELAIDYSKYFSGRVLIITGVGRSGTTILGKLIGSMAKAIYLFEPAIMKYCLWMCPPDLPGILMEDYLLPIIQGRAVNLNKTDDSNLSNYYGKQFTELGGEYLNDKKAALRFIDREKPLWVIKTNEIAPWAKSNYELFFPNVKFLSIIRNGNDVIGSSIARGWYTDEYMNNQIVDFVTKRDTYNCPWYLAEEDKQAWRDWTQVTRCACVWRTLVESFPPNISYENLIADPDPFAEMFALKYGLKTTAITRKHINSILGHPTKEYPDFFPEIQEPEKKKYLTLLEEYGYR
jgi:hypothetical protein